MMIEKNQNNIIQENLEAKLLLNQRMLMALATATNELLINNNFISALTNSLKIMGKAIDVDRIYCFKNLENNEEASEPELLAQWESNYIQTNKFNKSHLPFAKLTNFMNPVFKGTPVITLTKDILDNEAKSILTENHIKEIIFMPIFDGDKYWGFIECEECEVEVDWAEEEISILNYFTTAISGAINRKNYEKEIKSLSFKDQLTGLYNRRFYEEEVKRLDTKRNLPITIVLGDVNGLKLINDCFGHVVGDKLIKKAAEIIKNTCRTDDVVARLGGDEFVMLFPNTNNKEAEEIIKRINSMAAKTVVGDITTSISFGCGTKTTDQEKIEEIFNKAEEHMYRTKLDNSSKIKRRTIEQVLSNLFEIYNHEKVHSKHVGKLCESIAIALGLGNNDITQMKLVGNMHDIGKIGIDPKILNKKNKLTEKEYDEVKRHPEIGYRILSSVNEFSEIANYILEHHERWDGKGYPKGLKGDKISLQARITAVADAYDAMTSNRSYGVKMNKQEAKNELLKKSGTQFDPNIVKIFTEKVI